MKEFKERKILGEILERNLKAKTSYSMIMTQIKACGIQNSDVVLSYIKKLRDNKEKALQITYDTMLECQGYVEPGKSVDSRYIKHRDRKQGWWD